MSPDYARSDEDYHVSRGGAPDLPEDAWVRMIDIGWQHRVVTIVVDLETVFIVPEEDDPEIGRREWRPRVVTWNEDRADGGDPDFHYYVNANTIVEGDKRSLRVEVHEELRDIVRIKMVTWR